MNALGPSVPNEFRSSAAIATNATAPTTAKSLARVISSPQPRAARRGSGSRGIEDALGRAQRVGEERRPLLVVPGPVVAPDGVVVRDRAAVAGSAREAAALIARHCASSAPCAAGRRTCSTAPARRDRRARTGTRRARCRTPPSRLLERGRDGGVELREAVPGARGLERVASMPIESSAFAEYGASRNAWRQAARRRGVADRARRGARHELRRVRELGVDRPVGGLEAEDQDALVPSPRRRGAASTRSSRRRSPAGGRTARARASPRPRPRSAEEHGRAGAKRRPLRQPHPGRGDDAERALRAAEEPLRRGPGATGGKPLRLEHPGRASRPSELRPARRRASGRWRSGRRSAWRSSRRASRTRTTAGSGGSVRPCGCSCSSSEGPSTPASTSAARERSSTWSTRPRRRRSRLTEPAKPSPTSGSTPPTTEEPPP